MIVSDLMSKDVIYVSPETSVTDARALMTKENVNKLPVLDRDNRLVGIVTKNDLTKASPSAATTLDVYEMSYLLSKLKVEKVMVKNVTTVDHDEVIEEAARIMADKNVGCLPVMNGDLLVGIITESDLFHAFIEMFGARHRGVRFMGDIAEKPGELAKISQSIAELGGNIVSIVTSEGCDVSKRRITCKVTHVTIEQVKSLLENMNVEPVDIREV
ncbi:MAG: CBS domain-containing protein [Treponema sp.]|nr:CBS domain-containing protein [Treponema sp.]